MALVGHYAGHRGSGELLKKLTDYLQWLAIWGNAAVPGEIGQGSGPAQNPPPLDGHSAAVLNWYYENVTVFARDHGLISGLVQGLGLRGDEKAITLAKLNGIYEAQLRQTRKATMEEIS